jgi:segregation and condensation protein A
MDYQVNLETFRGPLDLLLYLVKHDEIDIRDIPIARVTEQFLEHLRVIELIDVELAGDFLVMAATLMEIKSRMLLPRADEAGAEDADPRQELVRQLLEYKKFKDAAALLEAQAEKHMARLPREPMEQAELDPAAAPIRAVELWDLVSAFGRLMRETMALAPQQIVIDETPIQDYMESITAQLDRQPRMAFRDLFTPPYTRGRLLGLFLAILELIKGRRVLVDQPDPFGEIMLSKAADPGLQASSPEPG